MNAYRLGSVSLSVQCQSVCMIQRKNFWTDFDKTSYARYAIVAYPKIVLFDFLQFVTPTWRTNKLVRWDWQ
jgi:hypothetical protein